MFSKLADPGKMGASADIDTPIAAHQYHVSSGSCHPIVLQPIILAAGYIVLRCNEWSGIANILILNAVVSSVMVSTMPSELYSKV